MTDSDSDAESDRPTIAPFLGALAVIVVVVVAVIAFNVLGDNEASPEQQVAQAAVGQNDALQRQDYAAFRDFTCRADQATEADVLARQRDSVAKNGPRYVDDVAAIRVDGDRATATVVYSFDEKAETASDSEVGFVLQDGAWKVCST